MPKVQYFILCLKYNISFHAQSTIFHFMAKVQYFFNAPNTIIHFHAQNTIFHFYAQTDTFITFATSECNISFSCSEYNISFSCSGYNISFSCSGYNISFSCSECSFSFKRSEYLLLVPAQSMVEHLLSVLHYSIAIPKHQTPYHNILKCHTISITTCSFVMDTTLTLQSIGKL